MNIRSFLRPLSLILLSVALTAVLAGCGYSTRSALPPSLRKINVEQFKNQIDFTDASRRNIYFPRLEVDVHNALVDRYVFDGSMRIAEPENADVILKGELVAYERHVLRRTDSDDVEEYRIQIVVNLQLIDVDLQAPMWREDRFVGQADYFVTGPLATTEDAAVREAIKDLARRIVERTIENW